MSIYATRDARPLGKGKESPAESVTDAALASLAAGYKRGVARRYQSLMPEELEATLPRGPLQVSPKIDGELWHLLLDGSDCVLISPTGRVLWGDIPVLREAKKVALPRVAVRTMIAGELFAARKKGRPRVDDLAAAMGGEASADVSRLAFSAFDVVAGGDAEAEMPLRDYPDRLALLRRLLDGGKRLHPVKTEQVATGRDGLALYDQWCSGGKAEGVVIRSPDGRIFKVKPSLTIDAVVVGYTERTGEPDQAGSLLLALVREDGKLQLIGRCGNLGDSELRQDLHQKFAAMQAPSTFRHASRSGALYWMVRPEVVVEVRLTDVQSESWDGRPIPRMVLHFQDGTWSAVRTMPAVSILHPVLVRLRDDKRPDGTDAAMAQLADRCLIPAATQPVEEVLLPPSEVLRREVYVKETKGQKTVRKLLMWETGKQEQDPDFPAFVVHWTDYSPARKDPLKREVRLAPTRELATELADGLIASNIKRGWARLDD